MNKDIIISLLSDITNTSKEEIIGLPKNAALSELGLDSIKFIQLIVAIEEEFIIEINDSDLLFSSFETLEKLFSTLNKYFQPSSYKKVVICDCDNVLWHGISGEEEIYTDHNIETLQNALVDLFNNGVILCLCSTNEMDNIDNAFKSLSMPLNKEHILLSIVNFNDKAANIISISKELNLSPDSFMFLDDSDYQLGLIHSLIPEVETIKVDYKDLSFVDILKSYFTGQASDTNRTQLYKEQKKREKEKMHFTSVEEYNDSLETKLSFNNVTHNDSERIAELSQRTNQFNLSGKRYTKDDILAVMDTNNFTVLSLSATDKYGDMGIIGAAILENKHDCILIHSFYLSCRAFGRGFEFAMLNKIKETSGITPIYGIYISTDKNKRYSEFYNNNGVMQYEL